MRKPIAVLVAAALLPLVAAVRPAEAAPGCGFPGRTWSAKTPASLRLDADKLQSALDFATQHTSATVLVLRHGCLAGASRLDGLTSKVPLDGWSMTKSVTALLVGRAVSLGKLDIDRPIARLFPEADRAHGRLTPRHLLTMSSGLHLNWLRDLRSGDAGPRARRVVARVRPHARDVVGVPAEPGDAARGGRPARGQGRRPARVGERAALHADRHRSRSLVLAARPGGTHRRLGASVDDVTRLGAPRLPRPARRRVERAARHLERLPAPDADVVPSEPRVRIPHVAQRTRQLRHARDERPRRGQGHAHPDGAERHDRSSPDRTSSARS